MKRRRPAPRKKASKPRRTPVPKINRARNAKNFVRSYYSKERVEWVQRQPCAICNDRPSENAHIRGDGMGRKAGYREIANLCHRHHAMLHKEGRANFENSRSITLDGIAAWLDMQWQRYRAEGAGQPDALEEN